MHIINAEEQHIPAIRRIYAHHVLHGTGSFETAPEHAGNACPGEKRSVTWISLVYRPAGAEKPYSIMP
jgi:phosphinothricin acetyltransferase